MPGPKPSDGGVFVNDFAAKFLVLAVLNDAAHEGFPALSPLNAVLKENFEGNRGRLLWKSPILHRRPKTADELVALLREAHKKITAKRRQGDVFKWLEQLLPVQSTSKLDKINASGLQRLLGVAKGDKIETTLPAPEAPVIANLDGWKPLAQLLGGCDINKAGAGTSQYSLERTTPAHDAYVRDKLCTDVPSYGDIEMTEVEGPTCIRVASIFGMSRGLPGDRPNFAGFGEMGPDAWEEPWHNAPKREAAWRAFAGQRHETAEATWWGASVDKFIIAYSELLFASADQCEDRLHQFDGTKIPKPGFTAQNKSKPGPSQSIVSHSDLNDEAAIWDLDALPPDRDILEGGDVNLTYAQWQVWLDVNAGIEHDEQDYGFGSVYVTVTAVEPGRQADVTEVAAPRLPVSTDLGEIEVVCTGSAHPWTFRLKRKDGRPFPHRMVFDANSPAVFAVRIPRAGGKLEARLTARAGLLRSCDAAAPDLTETLKRAALARLQRLQGAGRSGAEGPDDTVILACRTFVFTRKAPK